jgi:hypothetical protein
MIERVAALIDQGNQLFRGGDNEGARQVYERAMQEIPQVRSGYQRLRELEDLAEQREQERVAAAVAEGDRRYVAGEYRESIERYGEAMRALGEGDPAVERAAARIADASFRLYEPRDAEAAERLAAAEARAAAAEARASDLLSRAETAESRAAAAADRIRQAEEAAEGAREELARAEETLAGAEAARAELARREAERQALIARIESIRARYRAAVAGGSSSASTTDPDELSRLLEAKLLTRQILSSREIRTDYPRLYDNLDRYFEVYGEERKEKGRAEAVQDMAAILEAIRGSLGEAAVTTPSTSENLLLALLDELEAMLR